MANHEHCLIFLHEGKTASEFTPLKSIKNMKDSLRHRKTCRDLINSEQEGGGKWRDMGETTQSILVTVKSCLEVSMSGGGN